MFNPQPKPIKRSKYGNKFHKVGSFIYDSKQEARYSETLEKRRLVGEIKEWTRQHCLRLDVNGIHICKYYIDFRVILKNGKEEFHEVKGIVTTDFRIKFKLAQAIYGKEKFVLIDVRDKNPFAKFAKKKN